MKDRVPTIDHRAGSPQATPPPGPAGRPEHVDRELEIYRNLMEVPSTFEDGFSYTSLAGAIFIALLMVPGAMYMGLLAGMGVGPAAQWVTVILFIEVARRAHKRLKRPEIFVLFYMAGAVMASPFSGLLWNQFFVNSQAARATGVAEQLPTWFAPQDPLGDGGERTFFQLKWLPAILLVVFSTVVGRLNNMVLGYGLFRIASDVEKLPFPMAPVGAQGITALAEESTDKGQDDSWRWRIFSVGGALGLVFGAVYLALPIISGAIFNKPVMIFPIPFSDWTKLTQDYLPAVATGLSWDMGQLVFGMVLPFFAMVGSFVAVLLMMVGNVYLRQFGVLKTWKTNDTTLTTLFNNNIDFYFSFGIGLALAIAIVGIYQGWQSYRRAKRRQAQGLVATRAVIPPSRGDMKNWFVITTYLVTTAAYIAVSGFLLKGGYMQNPSVLVVMLVYGFLYTPLLSYITARLEGMAGQAVEIPMVRESAFILSGYQGVDIWFLPVPLQNYGSATVFYRQAELTGTRFWSIWKAELVLVPTVLVASILFANFIWSLAPIPSVQYPFADQMWEFQSANMCIIYSSTLGQWTPFNEALKPQYIAGGVAVGVATFSILGALGAPTMLMYGFVRGLSASMPHVVIPQFVGACIGKFYFERKMGLKWRQYVPVVAAGFSCGMGLITVLAIGVMFLAKAVHQLSF